MKAATKALTEKRITMFLKSLEGNLGKVTPGKEFPASTIDNYLRRTASDARLEDFPMNRIAFEVWKHLEESGAYITGHDRCQIIPDPDIASKLARAVGRELGRKKP